MTNIYITSYNDPGACQFDVTDFSGETSKMPMQIVSGLALRDWVGDTSDSIRKDNRICEQIEVDDWQ